MPKSRAERPMKTKIGTELAHVARDSDTTLKVKRSKVKLHGWGHCGGLPHSLLLLSVLLSEMQKPHLLKLSHADRQYKFILLILHTHQCNMNISSALLALYYIAHHRLVCLETGIKQKNSVMSETLYH